MPIAWLWRHRIFQGQAMGIVHLYRPGAWQLSHRQRRRLWFRLWLARCWGMRIVTTDAGGWWQSTRNLRFLARRTLERNLLYSSDIVLAYTRQPEQLYPDKKLRRHIRCLPHPGYAAIIVSPYREPPHMPSLVYPAIPASSFSALPITIPNENWSSSLELSPRPKRRLKLPKLRLIQRSRRSCYWLGRRQTRRSRTVSSSWPPSTRPSILL